MPSGQVMGSSVTPCKYGSANDVIGVRVEEVSASTGGVSSQKSPLLSSLTSPLQQPESESAMGDRRGGMAAMICLTEDAL